MLSQIKANCHQEINKLNNKNGNEAANVDAEEHFNYKNYILQQKDLLSKIYQQQKKLKKFSSTRNRPNAQLPASNTTNLTSITSNNENKKLLVDSSPHTANLLLNSLQIEHLKKSSNSLKPYSPNFSKKKILILNQLVLFICILL